MEILNINYECYVASHNIASFHVILNYAMLCYVMYFFLSSNVIKIFSFYLKLHIILTSTCSGKCYSKGTKNENAGKHVSQMRTMFLISRTCSWNEKEVTCKPVCLPWSRGLFDIAVKHSDYQFMQVNPVAYSVNFSLLTSYDNVHAATGVSALQRN